MKKKPRLLQKISSAIGVLSFLAAIVCGVVLYSRIDEAGMNDPLSASLLASIFFFFFVGIVLTIVGRTNIPHLGFDSSDPEA